MRKLIDRLNKQGGDEAHVFREILRTIQKRRQNKTDQETYAVKLQSTITINLIDYTSHIRNDLAEALEEIDPPELIERIHECPVAHCGHLFWAGTSRKKACNKHGDRVRKANNRRDINQRKKAAAAKSKKEEATKTFDGMNRTQQSVIRAIMVSGAREFGEIDGTSWHEFFDDGRVPRSTLVVRRVTHKLHKDGFLTYHESADRRNRYGFSPNDYYYPTQKLIDLWNDSQPPAPH